MESSGGVVLWMTGLSGAGKSTLASAFLRRYRGPLTPVNLDGDFLRTGLCRDLGFSLEDRTENVRRMAEVAKLFADQGFVVVCSLISPLAVHREHAKAILGSRMYEVFIDASLETCRRRDAKRLYKRADAGEIPLFTGVTAPYEIPEKPDLVINTEVKSEDDCVEALVSFCEERAGARNWTI